MTDDDLDCLTTVDQTPDGWEYRCIVCSMESMPLPNEATARRYARLHEISGTHRLREIMVQAAPRHLYERRFSPLVSLMMLALIALVILAIVWH